ncbi:hypothetical protein EIN_234690 [Entamoeba invadens IP1]|uniref:Ras n=1 Tax=Entamoeba invadens IP1 TaxID=370355 RepID=L7FKP6_ENTIV|nr:hypothetical protein EIN_234690 [Entamoeba invadens IP1]ELP86012.1 hypothetical protein EIN_234690 [Entamoeba invadens IP1]|eukprot:XP_004185358.1 hypothetical protein EIN_234690 [Entamoeba invadens IP1]
METIIMLLGDGGVGKTSIAIRLVHNIFTKIYDPSNDNPFLTSITVDNKTHSILLLDFACFDECKAYRYNNINKSDGFIVVYSIIDLQSFNEVKHHIETIYRIMDKDVNEHIPIVLCGNKCDLECNRIVTTKDGKILAEEFNIFFYEVSAKNNINIKEVINDLLRDILKHKNDMNTTAFHNDIVSNTKSKSCFVC